MKILNTNSTQNLFIRADCLTDYIEIMAVLVEDGMGQQAVYIGTWQNQDKDAYTQERQEASYVIMQGGQKLNYKEALGHFPLLKEEKYRR